MRARRRGHPVGRSLARPVPGDAAALASTASYMPSAEHKDHYSPLWGVGKWTRRGDTATRCPRDISLEQANDWLRAALSQGTAGPVWPADGAYPEYVWARVGETVFEARLSNREQGAYHGYPLDPTEWPSWI